MPAPRKFTHEQLRDAALAIVDEQGLDALTMRALAARLGTGAMTIYNYVDRRDGLDGLVTSGVWASAPLWAERHPDWRDDLREVASGLWRAVRAHPNAIPLLLTRRTQDWTTLDQAEALLEALRRGGFRGFALLAAFRAVSGFVAGFAQAELAGPLSLTKEDNFAAVLARMRALPIGRYPGLREVAEAAAATSPTAEFTEALDLVIAGLSSARRAESPDSVC
ncbi:MAG TPA: TetR/AcrR family transcriptional regulator C-terminal domain-containing protein [Pseudonocardia sp.]|uniref:TetR/AcrR family transcriptional regulator n=1 Tax=Pseudonocardia sp. TaxID=60912 RepID=UPI002ED94BBA